MKRNLLLLICILLGSCSLWAEKRAYTVDCIWGQGTYNSFTSLIKYKGKFYCAFREGRGHVFDENGKAEGKIRILRSANGKKWTSVAFFGQEGMDFRDPKLSVTPDGRLSVSIGVSVYVNKQLKAQIPHVCFSDDGINYTQPQKCVVEGGENHKTDWIWRTTWYNGTGYAANYYSTQQGERHICLMETRDAINYREVAELQIPDFPNEATIRFLPGGEMAMMVRRDGGDCMGYWGIARAPFTQWEWKKMPFRLGGPDFLVLDDQRIIASSRCHHIDAACTTSLYMGDVQTARFSQRLVLPSGGDTSYCGMIIEGDELWVSYYSGHASHWPSIYLAKIPLSFFNW